MVNLKTLTFQGWRLLFYRNCAVANLLLWSSQYEYWSSA